MATESTPTKSRSYKKQVILALIAITSPVWGIALMLTLTVAEVFYPLPNIEQIANPETKLATQIISEDNEVLGTFYSENRTIAT
jgi:penicillin-binding protein 1A